MTDDRMPGDETPNLSDYLPDSLKRPPIIDILNSTSTGKQQIALIKATVAKGATDGEVAQFLELCAQYGLDWNAHEAWCAVSTSQNGKRSILLMVGRNGLRKIAQRQGLRITGDVIREKDEFAVTATQDGHAVSHTYSGITEEQRGPIVGGWAQVLDGQSERGFFVAPLAEYLPTSEAKLKYSPWGSQKSTMILAAAERQALSQATPLGGLLAHGELDRAEEARALTAGTGSGEAVGLDLGPKVEEVIVRATELGHAGLSDRATVEMRLGSQPPEYVEAWVTAAHAELDRMAAEGDVVDSEAVEEPEGAKT